MLKKYNRLLLLFAFVLSAGALGYVVFFISPDTSVGSGVISLPSLFFFFPLVFVMIFSITTFITKRPVFGGLVAGTIIVYLIFRLTGLTHPFFLFLLLALFVTFLLLLRKEK